jgi:hypothetical protein
VAKLVKVEDWWGAWWEALHYNPTIVQALITLRQNSSAAAHLSILRVADIVTWMK